MTRIDGKTQIVGLIGWPVSHSVSPLMHNAAFDALGLAWRYVPLPVATEPDRLIADAVRGLRGLGLRGANVTVPHKQAVMPHLDLLTPAARAIGAVNTIRVEADGRLLGDNTDGRGFIADLREHGVDAANADVLVLGAGGSARAVVYGLAEAGAASIAILNRTVAKAEALADTMQPAWPKCQLSAHELPTALPPLAASATLIVNCTSLGMTPRVEGWPWRDDVAFSPRQAVYDLVYNPPQTRLLQVAAAQGAQSIGGLGMLVWQGAIAFELWTGQPAPVDVMRTAALRAFGGDGQ